MLASRWKLPCSSNNLSPQILLNKWNVFKMVDSEDFSFSSCWTCKFCCQRFILQLTTYTVVIVVIIPAAAVAEWNTLVITEHIIIITLTALCARFCLLTKGWGKDVIARWWAGRGTGCVMAVGWTGQCCVGKENRSSVIKYIKTDVLAWYLQLDLLIDHFAHQTKTLSSFLSFFHN